MSLIYKHPSGGELYQAGAEEIPSILKQRNIHLLILAAEEYQPEHIPGTNGGFTSAEVIYVPLKDTIFFRRGEFDKTVNRAKKVSEHAIKHLEKGNNVLSTCWAGLNRSGLISGLTIRKLSGAPGKSIVRNIRRRRNWRALSNPLFARIVTSS